MRSTVDERLDNAVTGGTWFSCYWLPVLIYAGLIFYLSSLSHPEEYAPLLLKRIGDKVAHAIEYGVLGCLCYRAFHYAAGAWGARYALFLAVAASTAYGLTDELHQAFVPLRQADGWDFFTDMMGAALGAAGWHWRRARDDRHFLSQTR